MSQEQIDYKQVRRRVDEEVKKEKTAARWVLFTFSMVITIVFITAGWAFAGNRGLLETSDGLIAAVLLTIASAMSMIFQAIILSIDTKSGDASMRQRLIAKELAEEMLRMGEDADELQEKQKRAMRLAADGELEEIVEEEPRQRRVMSDE